MGTMDFMMSRHAEDMSSVDGRADIYSLVCTPHYLVNGRPIDPGNSAINQMLATGRTPFHRLVATTAPSPHRSWASY